MSALESAKLPSPARSVAVEKPRFNVYTMMLVVSLLAVMIGCLFLYGELSQYDFDHKAASAKNI